MPRRARLSLAGVPHHLIQRGNNRSACFYTDQDYQFYLDWLAEYAKLYHKKGTEGLNFDQFVLVMSYG